MDNRKQLALPSGDQRRENTSHIKSRAGTKVEQLHMDTNGQQDRRVGSRRSKVLGDRLYRSRLDNVRLAVLDENGEIKDPEQQNVWPGEQSAGRRVAWDG